jgi:hypothetical protein
MDLASLALTVITSTSVSAIVTFVLQTYLSKRIEYDFARRLEQYKSDLAIRLDKEHGITTRRLEGYPRIVELCYRTRNMARDLTQSSEPSQVLVTELRSRAKELEDLLFRFRMDLETDHVFVPVHRYKNLALQFVREISDALSAVQGPELSSNKDFNGLLDLFALLEESYQNVVKALSSGSDENSRKGDV